MAAIPVSIASVLQMHGWQHSTPQGYSSGAGNIHLANPRSTHRSLPTWTCSPPLLSIATKSGQSGTQTKWSPQVTRTREVMISSELHSTPVVVRSILSKKEAGWWFWSCDFLWFFYTVYIYIYIYIYIVYVYNVYIYIYVCMYIFLMFFQKKSRWHAFETSKQRTLGWDQIPPGSSGDDRAWGIVFNGKRRTLCGWWDPRELGQQQCGGLGYLAHQVWRVRHQGLGH